MKTKCRCIFTFNPQMVCQLKVSSMSTGLYSVGLYIMAKSMPLPNFKKCIKPY